MAGPGYPLRQTRHRLPRRSRPTSHHHLANPFVRHALVVARRGPSWHSFIEPSTHLRVAGKQGKPTWVVSQSSGSLGTRGEARGIVERGQERRMGGVVAPHRSGRVPHVRPGG